MKAQQVETSLHRIAKRAGLGRKLTPNTLRRIFGSDLQPPSNGCWLQQEKRKRSAFGSGVRVDRIR
jgi:hypothetical protein